MSRPRSIKGATTRAHNGVEQGPTEATRTLAKWLVPSTGILLALVGYVIESAQRSLLAFPTDDGRIDQGGRLQDAADFLRFMVTLAGDRLVTLSSLKAVSLGGHWLVITMSTALVALVVSARLLPSRWRRVAALLTSLAPYALVLLVGAKFVYFDAPAMRVESVVVGVGVAVAAVDHAVGPNDKVVKLVESASAKRRGDDKVVRVDALTQPLAERLDAQGDGPVGRFIASRASRLWLLIVCSRMGIDLNEASRQQGFANGITCTKSDPVLSKRNASALLAGEFDSALWMGALIAVIAILLVARRASLGTALGVLALAYLLTVPYAWGKLLKPVDFPYALVRASPEIFLLRTERGAKPLDVQSTYAFVLARDAGAVTLLHGIREMCSWDHSVDLRFSSVPASKIVAVEQIYRLDVIEWALRTQRSCPLGPPPPS